MFTINNSLTDLKVKERNIYKMLYSMNSPQVATPDLSVEEARCYVLFFSEGTNLSAYIGLYLPRNDKKLFYAYSSNPFPFEAAPDVEVEATGFAEDMGFLLDEINVSGMPADDRNRWIEEQFIFGYKKPDLEEEPVTYKTDEAPKSALDEKEKEKEKERERAAEEAVKAAEAAVKAAEAAAKAEQALKAALEKDAATEKAGRPVPHLEPVPFLDVPHQQEAAPAPPAQPQQPVQQVPLQPQYQQPAPQPYQAPPTPQHAQTYQPVPPPQQQPPVEAPPKAKTAAATPKKAAPAVQPKAPVVKKAAKAPVEAVEEQVTAEGEEAPAPQRTSSVYEEALKEGVVRPPIPKAQKPARSAKGSVSRDKEALARLLSSF